MEEDTWKVINSYFKEYPDWQAQYQIDIYNDFINNRIPLAFKNKNHDSVIIFDKEDPELAYRVDIYLGGKTSNKYKLCPPSIMDHTTGKMRPMYPNEARLKNLSYSFDIFYDIDVEVTMKKGENIIIDHVPLPHAEFLKNNYLGKIPIMLRSNMCILNKIPSIALPEFGESEFEFGGYYIIDGREKIIMSQERKAENILFFTTAKPSDTHYTKAVEVKSISDEAFEYSRTCKIQLEVPGAITLRLGQKNPFLHDKHIIDGKEETRDVPLFIIFRLLGIESDQDIITMIAGDLNTELGKALSDLLRPSAQDRYIRKFNIYTKQTAENFLEPLTSRSQTNITNNKLNEISKNKLNRLSFLYDTIEENCVPHVGKNHYTKACYLAYMTRRLLLYSLGLETETIRDSFINKRIDTGGFILSVLFKDALEQTLYSAFREIKRKYEFDGKEYSGDKFLLMINENTYREIFLYNVFNDVFSGSIKKGTIGQKEGVVQQIDRLNYFSASSHIRRISDPVTGGLPQDDQRRINVTQYGYICPCESVEGQNVGLRKALSVLTTISVGYPTGQLKELCYKLGCVPIRNISKSALYKNTKVFINGSWIGCVAQPNILVTMFRLMRRNGLINAFTSIAWYTERDEILIFCDGGRLVRPMYILENNELVLQSGDINALVKGTKTFTELCFSRLPRKDNKSAQFTDYLLANLDLLGLNFSDPELDMKLRENQAAIEYIDVQESDTCMFTVKYEPQPTSVIRRYTHCEIHPTMILGASAQISTLIDLGQSGKYLGIGSSKHPKQAVSTYATNFMHRIDTSAHLLHNPERAIIHGRLNEMIHHDKIGTGNNIIVAIAYYNGYNQEDSICGNSSSIDYGLFGSSYYKMYEEFEKIDSKSGLEERFYNPLYRGEIEDYPADLEPKGNDYTNLDKFGFIKEGTYLTKDNDVLIGKYLKTKDENGEIEYEDISYRVKKDNKGSYIDKVFTCPTNSAGHRLCKIRTCQYRKPEIGDKFASRNGQKGTFGLVIPREDMPFTDDGIVPDMIIHPSAYPKRMTLNQLTEILYGTLAAELGMFGVAGTMETFDSDKINDVLSEKFGFSYFGDKVLYNGPFGEQMSASIFMGPVYYQRLKYMVADKINTRSSGLREDGVPVPGGAYTVRERQVVSGRANGGGIKIGEMERDALVSHGIFGFINERDMVRGDKFIVYISAATGEISIANPHKNIFFDAASDGPLSYHLEEGSAAGNEYLLGINTSTRVQKDFFRIQIPYAMKLVIHELNGLGISMKLNPRKLRMLVESEGQNLDNMIIGLEDLIDQQENDIAELLQKSLVEQMENIDEATAESEQDARDRAKFEAAGIDYDSPDELLPPSNTTTSNSPLVKSDQFIFRRPGVELPHPANTMPFKSGDDTSPLPPDTASRDIVIQQELGSVIPSPVSAPLDSGQIPEVMRNQLGGGEQLSEFNFLKKIDSAPLAKSEFTIDPTPDDFTLIPPSTPLHTGGGGIHQTPSSQIGGGMSQSQSSHVMFAPTSPTIIPPLLPAINPVMNQMQQRGGGDVKQVRLMSATDIDLVNMGIDMSSGNGTTSSTSTWLPPIAPLGF